ncbi:MAG: hypothetical protein ICV60_06505 [Pyrinomonadaceae bacterium]|nr:hypothetical protein [Pyrinomonadaceae bacterium]
MDSPMRNLGKLKDIILSWGTHAPEKSFAGMTLAQFKARVQPSFDVRQQIEALEAQIRGLKSTRADADKESLRLAQLVVNSVKGDPEEGPNSDLYEGMGYTREDERKSGLTRKKKEK